MSDRKTKVAVIGAGPMGLVCAYELLKQGFHVTIFERDDRIGGMSASFELGGSKIERFYHFICATDYPLFNLLKELSLLEKVVWRQTHMGFYYQDKLYPWGDPISLLKFPKLSFWAKLRYGLHVFYTKHIHDWTALDKVNAITWLKKWVGEQNYKILWDKLFSLKFHEYQHDLSAAWIGARIQRLAKSRTSLFKESLGYLQGGSDTLLDVLEEKILSLGGEIELQADVQQIVVSNQNIKGIKIAGEFIPFDRVVSTIPLPYLPKLAPDLPSQLRDQIADIANVGVACVVFKLKFPLTPYFWVNINHDDVQIPGIIEYSNLNPESGNIIYAPYYMPQTHPKYRWPDEHLISEVSGYLHKINPRFSQDWIVTARVARYGFAQTVCSPGFFAKLPVMKTPITGFYMADTAFYYPEDRCISESARIGIELARFVQNEC